MAGPGLVCADALLDLGNAIHWRESSLYDHWFHDEPLVSAAWMQDDAADDDRQTCTDWSGRLFSWALAKLFSKVVEGAPREFLSLG